MRDVLTVSLVQSSIYWENIEKNLVKHKDIVNSLTDDVDIIVFPELFSTGFTINVNQMAESMEGSTIDWLKNISAESGASIICSVLIKEDKKYFNRLLYVDPSGNIQYYNKRHLFRITDENRYFTAGNAILTIQHGEWRIRPLICYDLRFPVWSRNTDDYDLLVYIANWPANRIDIWTNLLKARAIENQSYVIGVNRVGTDGNNISYTGKSIVINAEGKEIAELKGDNENVLTSKLSISELYKIRKKFPAHLDRDHFKILP